MFGSALPFRRWLALLGMVAAAGLLVGTLESVGFEAAADIVVVAYILWSIWLALFGYSSCFPDLLGTEYFGFTQQVRQLPGSKRGGQLDRGDGSLTLGPDPSPCPYSPTTQ